METIPRYELLKDACAIIDGMPEEVIMLGPPCSRIGDSLESGTVCDPAGWLALHPEFRQLGLSITEDGQHLLYNGLGGHDRSPAAVMGMVFGMDMREAERLFAPRDDVFPDDLKLSDKQLWLRRVHDYLHAHGQLHHARPERADELANQAETISSGEDQDAEAFGDMNEHKLRIEGPNSQQPVQLATAG